MEAIEIIANLRANGFNIQTNGDYIDLSPMDRVSDELIQIVRHNKIAIIETLKTEGGNDGNVGNVVSELCTKEKDISLPHVKNESDDRNKCSDCVHLSVRGYCGKWKITNPHNERYKPVRDVLHRCGVFER